MVLYIKSLSADTPEEKTVALYLNDVPVFGKNQVVKTN